MADAPVLSWIAPPLPGQEPVEYDLGAPAFGETGWVALRETTGFGLAQRTITSDPMPRGGTRVRHIQPEARTLNLPLMVEGADHAQFLTRWRLLAQAFADTRVYGPGQLVVARPDGTRRLLDCYYQAGWEANPDGGILWDTPIVSLYAPDPFWRAEEPTLITRTYGAAGGSSFLAPLITVTSGNTLGATTVDNPGGVEAWPTWRIAGPASSITATNITTGESWTLDPVAWRGSALLAGEEVTITTEPAVILGPAGSGAPLGTNWAGAINFPAAVMWGLMRGSNEVDFVMTGSGAGSEIEATFYARFETA